MLKKLHYWYGGASLNRQLAPLSGTGVGGHTKTTPRQSDRYYPKPKIRGRGGGQELNIDNPIPEVTVGFNGTPTLPC